MERVVGMSEVKSRLAELIGEAKYGGTTFILRRHTQPMAVLMGIAEFERLQASATQSDNTVRSPLSSEMLRRQQGLMTRARSLRERLGAPEERLAELFADLPPEGDDFWLDVLETQ